MAEQIKVLQNEDTPQAKMIPLYWVGTRLADAKVVEDKEPTGEVSRTGVPFYKVIGKRKVPVTLTIADRNYTMPEIGEHIMVPEHLVPMFYEVARTYDEDGVKYDGFTRSKEYAQDVARYYAEGKPIPRTVDELVVDRLSGMATEDLEAILAQRRAAGSVEAEVSEEDEESEADSKDTKKRGPGRPKKEDN